MTEIDSPRPRARRELLYEAVVAGYLNDISGRRRRRSAARDGRNRRRRVAVEPRRERLLHGPGAVAASGSGAARPTALSFAERTSAVSVSRS
jgi:hypothetical protein